ncbi:hypothetical protein BJ684DRAFT_22554 [Piptocephalis cylindrospora]|uniref:Peptide hydrolase n=1 Tax=Piptocephalis cylindrospora TaxID=1907219 RepID=A0A4V1IYF8_9FUNG|nr:hypothetical protein BJ684DRAFT_22554 [Piptocephalis cylindrospora]|eukprot:RKP14409.1 hypothetical protein BJ684DRAFT_22554 [Piptocephalis cylindrospora]
MLISRTPGTEQHRLVQEHIVEVLQDLGWDLNLRTHEEQTPMGRKPFTNIIASPRPAKPGERRVIFAAHYDSKYFEEGTFLGATDSAVSCAVLLDIATALGSFLQDPSIVDPEAPLLQLVFFDGEEAFKEWTREDSLYGSRKLAEEWDQEGVLKDIDMLVLLDLLGFRNQHIPNLQPGTHHQYNQLRVLANRLSSQGHLVALQEEDSLDDTPYFTTDTNGWRLGMDDDHRPFLERGVSCLHAITYPFPTFWHTLGDDISVIDEPTSWDTALIFRAFAASLSGLGDGRLTRAVEATKVAFHDEL